MKKLFLALQFLTIVPVKVSGSITEKDIAGSAAFFPVVGAVQGLLTVVPAFLLIKVFPADITAGLALVALVVSNGGFDLDGLADTADGMAVKSSGDPEEDRQKRLTVMKDSSTGAMGVTALIITLLLKFLLMQRLLSDFPVQSAVAVLFLMPVISKWITVPAMYHGISARKDGLGKIFIEHTGAGSVLISTGIVLALVLAVSFLSVGSAAASSVGLCVLTMAAFYFFGRLAVLFLTKRFGGLTGDHFGALTEISEILFLLAGYAWLQHSI
jgi:adenosylcobinamide-GDP ribazoletransferase